MNAYCLRGEQFSRKTITVLLSKIIMVEYEMFITQ